MHIYLCFFFHSYLNVMNTVRPRAPSSVVPVVVGILGGVIIVCIIIAVLIVLVWIFRGEYWRYTCTHARTHTHTHTLTHPCKHTRISHCVHLLALCMYCILLPLASFSPDKCFKVRSKDSNKVELTRVTAQGVDKQENTYTNVASAEISGDVIGEEPAWVYTGVQTSWASCCFKFVVMSAFFN